MMLSDQQYLLNQEDKNASILLKELFDGFSYKIVMSTIEDSKTVFEICKENDMPISSTYKKIKKLKDLGLLFIDRIVINEKGKKVVFYKSKIQSVELILNEKQVLLQFKKNERNLHCSISQQGC
jgi:predicted methyltransferase